MARILILDTATKQCSVALSEHGEAVAWKEERTDGYVHAERLMPLIDALLDEHSWDKSSLEAVAVSGGPGSFTGLRIGVSTAKGLCHGTRCGFEQAQGCLSVRSSLILTLNLPRIVTALAAANRARGGRGAGARAEPRKI